MEDFLEDGVLNENARESIDEIKETADGLADSNNLREGSAKKRAKAYTKYRGENSIHGTPFDDIGGRRLVLAIVQDYVKHKQPATFAELQKAFPGKLGGGWNVVVDYDDEKIKPVRERRYLSKDGQRIALPSGEVAVVSGEWYSALPKEFFDQIEKFGYRFEEKLSASLPASGNRFRYTIRTLEREKKMEGFLEECVRVLRRFGQMILQGPPGTGKTRAAKLVVAEMLEVDGEKIDAPEYRGKRWDIVQFHPSYGYEDFVRGVRVKTEKGNAIYETVNRHFGAMAERAGKSKKEHFLIIDEINRANVAAVLGELIYGLEFEYRGEKITTQYAVGENDFSLIVPKNLFVIGTMNTADRTIGHIDYAVRRRFAFQTLLPKRAVVESVSPRDSSALDLFDKVSALFYGDDACVSGDFRADDVAIGHSYFLADDDDALRDKMFFQVVPILEEYLRDGVLNEDAREKIVGIKNEARGNNDDRERISSSESKQIAKWRSEYPNARWVNMPDNVLALMLKIVGGIGASEQWKLNPTPRSHYLGWKHEQSRQKFNGFQFKPAKKQLRVEVDIPVFDDAISESRRGDLNWKRKGNAYFAILLPKSNLSKEMPIMRKLFSAFARRTESALVSRSRA